MGRLDVFFICVLFIFQLRSFAIGTFILAIGRNWSLSLSQVSYIWIPTLDRQYSLFKINVFFYLRNIIYQALNWLFLTMMKWKSEFIKNIIPFCVLLQYMKFKIRKLRPNFHWEMFLWYGICGTFLQFYIRMRHFYSSFVLSCQILEFVLCLIVEMLMSQQVFALLHSTFS